MQNLNPEEQAVDGDALVVSVDPAHELRKVVDGRHRMKAIGNRPSVAKASRVGGSGQHGGDHFGFRIHAGERQLPKRAIQGRA